MGSHVAEGSGSTGAAESGARTGAEGWWKQLQPEMGADLNTGDGLVACKSNVIPGCCLALPPNSDTSFHGAESPSLIPCSYTTH
ncbi:unnamed protein product, partial [Rangifer tarandus platyrhynchus]